MGVLGTLLGPVVDRLSQESITVVVFGAIAGFLVLSVVLNIVAQLLFRNPKEPPVVFHWFPIIGSTISYGIDPYKFFFRCQQKYGDIFTFILLGKKTTVYLGTKGNKFILNGDHKDLNAEDVYGCLTTPVFGSDVVYDCPNEKLMEQKKFVKFGLTTEAFDSYVPLIVTETLSFLKDPRYFKGTTGVLDLPPAMSELVLYTASRCLQGKEVRAKFDSTFADLYHDLDMGFAPINFMLPWFPLPHNRRRDRANKKMAETYLEIIRERKASDNKEIEHEHDMIWQLTRSIYKNGTPIPDKEVAHMMIALLMAGQHSSASTVSWILLRLAQNPHIIEELLEEQKRVLGEDLPPLTHQNVQKLELNANCVKESLRIHAPIHSIMRKVTSPMPVEGTNYTIPTSHVVLAAPGATSRMEEFFPSPEEWDPHRWDAGKAAVAKTEVEDEKVDYGYGMVSKGTASPYLPFGAGRHRCIGEQFAYLQVGTIIATIVREMKLRNVGGSKDVVETDYSSLFSGPMRPAKVEFERRNTKH